MGLPVPMFAPVALGPNIWGLFKRRKARMSELGSMQSLEKGPHSIVSPLVGMYCLRMQAKAEAATEEEQTVADADKGNGWG